MKRKAIIAYYYSILFIVRTKCITIIASFEYMIKNKKKQAFFRNNWLYYNTKKEWAIIMTLRCN